MTFSHAMRLWRVFFLAVFAVVVAACGGSGDDNGNGSLRVVNATADVTSIDVTVEGLDDDNDDEGEKRFAAAVAKDGQSDYASIGDGNWRIRMKRDGASSSLALSSVAVTKDERYTVFAYGREGDYRLYAAFDDDEEDEPASGKAKVRVFNAAADAGSVDVYVTESSASLDDTIPTLSGVAGATMGFYTTVDRGTFRLRVTGINDKTDTRLDVEGLVLPDKGRVTIVLQPGPGGVLVNALVSQFQAGLSTLQNNKARARLVAGVTGNAGVTADLGGTSLNVNLRSPSVGSYALIPAGTVTANLRVNATTALSGTAVLSAGGDYTVAVYGDAAAPTWRLIADDNRPPASSEKAKMRLLHMAFGVDSLTLVKDYVAVANDVAYGNASIYGEVTSSTSARVEVSSPLSVTPLFLSEDAVLPVRSVFTVFMLGGSSVPTGILRRER
jgi:Domain of unknown function (DUF4397)